MYGSDNAAPGGHPGASAAATRSCPDNSRQFTEDCDFRQQVRHIHALGPRPLGEMLREIQRAPGDVPRIVKKYADLKLAAVKAADAVDWIEPADVIRVVRRAR
jgi:hypothetical protein